MKTQIYASITTLAAIVLPLHSQAQTEMAPWIMQVGEQRILRLPGLTRYSPSGSSVRATAVGDELLVRAVQPGSATLLIWQEGLANSRRQIRVEASSLRAQGSDNNALSRATGQLQEVEVYQAGDQIQIRGTVRSLEETARLSALERAFPKEVRLEVTYDPVLIDRAFSELEKWISSRPGLASKIQIQLGENQIRVRGGIPDPKERAEIERKLRSVFPALDLEIDSLPDRAPTVHFKVFLLELKRSRFGSLGISWPAQLPGAFKVSPWGIGHSLALEGALQALEGEGSLKVLSNPELVVRAPGEAELFAGGEIPIKTQSQYSSEVKWKGFGLILKLNVKQAAGPVVRLDIATEVSTLDAQIALEDIPGIQANRMRTQVDARFGQPLLLSGLLQQGMREAAQGLPLLRRIPILGALFGSQDYLNERSELVAVLLPQISPPQPQMHRLEPSRSMPKGPFPPPRNWVSQEEERALRNSAEWPWNAL